MITTDLKFNIEKTKDDYEILRVSKNDKWIYIGSKYNMKLEIDKFLDEVGEENDEKRVFLIYGFGAGEHIKALRSKFVKNRILVFEPNISLRNYINDISWIKKDKNIRVLCCEKDDLVDNIEKYIHEFNLSSTQVVTFSNYNNIYVNELRNFLKEIKDYFVGLNININTKIVFSKRWFETLIKNIPYMVEGTPIDVYENKYKDKPAIIVSAGPSLERNIDELKNINNEMLIISGGRTLRSLIDKQITPHLLTVADPGEISYELVKGYIEDLNVPLLFYEGTNEKVVEKHRGDKIFFSNNNFIDKIAEKTLVSFSVGGSVSHSMTACAIYMGCNPIIFIGQDLAYTNERKYSSISESNNRTEKFEEVKSENDIWVEDVNGGKVRTSLGLDQFRISFEYMIKYYKDIKFINATEGGARIKGTIEMPISEVIKKYKAEKIEPMETIEYPIKMRQNAIKALEEAEKAANFIIRKSKKTLRYLDDLEISYIMKNTNKVSAILARLDEIDGEIKEKYSDIELIESLLYPITYKVLTEKEYNNKPNNDEMKKIVKQNRQLYGEFIEELKYALTYINETLLKLKDT